MQQAHAKSNSPCVRICKIVDGNCIGCRRTIYEITNWTRFTDEERNVILEKIGKENDRDLG